MDRIKNIATSLITKMGSEQSTQSGPVTTPGASSDRSSISSYSEDIPYTAYTVNRPIGDSPKLQPKHVQHQYSLHGSPRIKPKALPPQSIVVVKKAVNNIPTCESDSNLLHLQEIPTFMPVLRGALNIPNLRDSDVLDRLDHKQILQLCLRYQKHIQLCAETISQEQNGLATHIREIDYAIATLMNIMTDRQKRFAKYTEQVQKVNEISATVQRIQNNLTDTVCKMDRLNKLLPPEEQLEPFCI